MALKAGRSVETNAANRGRRPLDKLFLTHMIKAIQSCPDGGFVIGNGAIRRFFRQPGKTSEKHEKELRIIRGGRITHSSFRETAGERRGMKKRILAYRRKIDGLLQENGGYDWAALKTEHLVQIAFFQHERLIHLLVTGLFALMEILLVALVLLAFSPVVLILAAAVLLLLIPYVWHYRLRENEVQKLYAQYDQIVEKCEEQAREA